MPSKLAIVAALTVTLFSLDARASQCDAPPYGDTDAAFKAFINNFSKVVSVASASSVLSAVCRMKYEGAARAYEFGFTDQDFADKGTADLAVQMLTAIRKMGRGE
jgi:hypothetical protein